MAGVVLAWLAAAGCADQPAGPPKASVASCVQFGVRAIERHVTVTSVPPACQGLTRAQINFAVGTALHALADRADGKSRRRALAASLSPLLAHLVTTLPAPRRLPPVSAPAAPRPGRPPYGLIALATWLLTVGLGSWMMARWITSGGLSQARAGRAGAPVSLIFWHSGLDVVGLLAWIAYLATGLASLAWTGCLLLLPVTGLGMALVSIGLSGRPLAAAPSAARPVPADAGGVPAGPGALAAGRGAALAVVRPGQPSARHRPALIAAAHGALAAATILSALLAAVGSR
jgi:hypothetical protein